MSFGSNLRQILDICHIKISSLAGFLGYDVSYISKWISGAKHPSEGSIEQICGKIGEFCCSSMQEGELRALHRFINVSHLSSKSATMQAVSDFLLKAYLQDKCSSSPLPLPRSADNTSRDLSEYQDCLLSLFRSAFAAEGCGSLDAIVSAETFLCLHELSALRETAAPSLTLNLHVFYDSRNIGSPAEYCRFLSAACVPHPNVKITLYEIAVPHAQYSDVVCVLRDHGMVLRAFSMLGRAFIACVTDAAETNREYDSLFSFLRGHNLKSHCYGDKLHEHFFFKFNSPKCADSTYLLSSDVFIQPGENYSNHELRLELLTHYNDAERLNWYSTQKILGSTVKEQYFYESAVIDFCRYGKGKTVCSFTDHIVLSPNARRQFLEALIHSIESGSLQLFILSDINPILSREDFNLSVACRGDLVCLLKANSTEVTYIETPYGIDCFRSIFEEIGALADDYVLRKERSLSFLRYAMSFIP